MHTITYKRNNLFHLKILFFAWVNDIYTPHLCIIRRINKAEILR